MTAQILDTLRLDGMDHDLVATRGAGLFDPAAHGLTVVMASTACYRGYVCGYVITGDRLELDRLDAKAGRYDDDDDFVPVEPPVILGRAPERIATPDPFNVVYRGLALPVAFTGQLLAGAEAIDELRAEAVHAPAWAYRRVHVFRLDGGRLIGREDLSAAMAAVRAQRPRSAAVPALQRADLAWIVETFPHES